MYELVSILLCLWLAVRLRRKESGNEGGPDPWALAFECPGKDFRGAFSSIGERYLYDFRIRGQNSRFPQSSRKRRAYDKGCSGVLEFVEGEDDLHGGWNARRV